MQVEQKNTQLYILICSKCGTKNPEISKFCYACGSSLSEKKSKYEEKDELIGCLLGNRFLIEKKIGYGGMGAVYRGVQIQINRPVAVKVIHEEYAKDENLLERFKNEATTASMLTHPNTVTIYDFGKTPNNSLYIAMEYLEGIELSKILKKFGPMSQEKVCELVCQICGSLEEAHNKGIVHRDLKPENIMICNIAKKQTAKILDFGIAKFKKEQNNKQLTVAGEIFGTPEFMSPEQIKGSEVTCASDIYSLGVILYQLLTGHLPFYGPSPMATFARHLTDDPKPFADINPNVSILPELESLVLLCLSKDIEKRPGNMEEIKTFLESLEKKLIIESSKPQRVDELTGKIQNMALEKSIQKNTPVNLKSEIVNSKKIDDSSLQKKQEQKPLTIKNLPEDTSIFTSKDEVIKDLLTRMKKKRDFPAISKHISELSIKVNNDSISARHLANTILKDYSLTEKLLRLINSPFYGQVRGKISTVTRAVVLMGFNQVRQSALGLLMFDHFCMQKGEQSQELSNSMLCSLLSGLTAKHLAAKLPEINAEEAFVCALMRSLGKNLVAFYFPKKYHEIMKKIKFEDMSEDAACINTLGVTFEDLADALGRTWGLPEPIIDSMQKLPQGQLDKPKNNNSKLRNIAAFSNELTIIASFEDLESKEEVFDKLQNRFEKTLTIEKKEIDELYIELTKKLEDYLEAMNLGLKENPIIKRVMAWSGQPVSSIPDAPVYDSFNTLGTIQPLNSYTPSQMIKQESATREKIMMQGTDEIAAAVSRCEDPDNILSMILETMLRGLKLSNVLFCSYDRKKEIFKATIGYGDDIDGIMRTFAFKPSRSEDIFTTSLAQGRDVFADLSKNQGYLARLPLWYKKAMEPLPRQLLIYPVLVNSSATGFIYGDVYPDNEAINRKNLAYMIKLRSGLVRSMKRSPKKFR